jgi:hypothetical protein
MQVRGGGDGSAQGSVSLEDGNWHMLVATWDNTTFVGKLYCDGALVGTINNATGQRGGQFAVAGSSAGGRYWWGGLDEVFGVGGLVATPTQVAALYDSWLHGSI